MKKVIRIVIFLAVVVLLVIGGARAVKHKKAEEAKLPPAKTYAVVVRTIRPQTGRTTLTVPALALVQNDNDTLVASKLAARVEAMHRAGARVKKGEVVVRLDTRELDAKIEAVKAKIAGAKAQLAAAKTALATVEARHARTEKLMKVRGASREQFDAEVSQIAQARAKIAEVTTQIEALKANLAEVTRLLSYAVIQAPVSGIVGKTFLNPGDMAMPGKPILAVSAKAGDYLLVRLPADVPAESVVFEGKRLRLYPLDHTFNGLQEYRTALLNDGRAAGSRVDVDAVVFEGEALRLPNDAVLDKNGRKVALVVKNGRAEATALKVLASGREGVAVANTELAGRPVIVAKPDILLRLLGGTPVKVLESGRREGK